MTPRTWSYDPPQPEAELEDNEALPVRDRAYEHFGEQGFAMADHAVAPPSRGAERVNLGERVAVAATLDSPPTSAGSDARITDDVCERLADDPYVDGAHIEVVVHHGAVTLTGIVDDRQQRQRAATLAESVRGVIEVVNRVSVASAPTSDPNGA